MFLIVGFFLLYLVRGIACDQSPSGDGFLPKNKLSIPVGNSIKGKMTGVTEAEFNSVIKNFETKFYDWMFEEFNADLIVFKSWPSNTVNAYAEQDGDKMMITIYGGIARHKAMTPDGFALVLCHELGHHLGGYPKKSTNRWSSAEGQADYYATMKCLKQLWETEDNATIVSSMNIPEFAKNRCFEGYKDKKEQDLCLRVSMAGKAVSLMFQDLDHESFEPEFHTPDPKITRMMDYLHPFPQCRLDTYFQGNLCARPLTEKLDEMNEHVGTCTLKNGDAIGIRPLCWFKPRD